MKNPTVFVDIASDSVNNPIAMALNLIAKAFGATQAEQLVVGEVEADIAITNSVETALRMLKETESTYIVLAHFSRDERAVAEAFANRNQGRVTAIPFVGFDGETEIGTFLQKLISNKTKES